MEEKNTNVSQTEENPEQNSPEISIENESTQRDTSTDAYKGCDGRWHYQFIFLQLHQRLTAKAKV